MQYCFNRIKETSFQFILNVVKGVLCFSRAVMDGLISDEGCVMFFSCDDG